MNKTRVHTNRSFLRVHITVIIATTYKHKRLRKGGSLQMQLTKLHTGRHTSEARQNIDNDGDFCVVMVTIM